MSDNDEIRARAEAAAKAFQNDVRLVLYSVEFPLHDARNDARTILTELLLSFAASEVLTARVEGAKAGREAMRERINIHIQWTRNTSGIVDGRMELLNQLLAWLDERDERDEREGKDGKE